jgi:uncharacterized protein YkwD
MTWALVIFLVALAPEGAAPATSLAPHIVRAHFAALDVQDQAVYDPGAEDELLDLANRARSRADVQPLQRNDCLTQAAQRHAETMAARQQLSHQFPREADLAQRFTEYCSLRFDEAAENVALADSADRAHDALMTSRAHRANLLYPSYNAVGMGVVRRGSTLYVVQDFAHVLPAYSSAQAEGFVGKSVQRIRAEKGLWLLEPRHDTSNHAEACALARSDSLHPPTRVKFGEARYVLRQHAASGIAIFRRQSHCRPQRKQVCYRRLLCQQPQLSYRSVLGGAEVVLAVSRQHSVVRFQLVALSTWTESVCAD